MRWFRRRDAPPTLKEDDTEPVDIGGDRLVFWKAKSEEVEGEIYGPVWIADANNIDLTLEEHPEWVTHDQAEEFARKRGLPLEEA